MRGRALPPRAADAVREAWCRAGEHEPPDALGVGPCPGHRDEPAVRVADDVEPLEAKVLAEGLDVIRVILEVVARRVGRPVGVAGPARVEDEERALGLELGKLAEVRRRAPGPTGVQHERRTGADLAPGEPAPIDRGQAWHHGDPKRGRAGALATYAPHACI